MLEPPLQPIVAGAETPDLQRTPFGFVSAERPGRIRTRAGAWTLATASLRVATALQPLLRRSASHRVARVWAKAVTSTLSMDLEITGFEQVDASRQYLVMPLHEGFVDVPTLLHLPLDLRFTVSEELFSMPNVGRYMAATRQLCVPDTPSVGGYKALYADIARAVTSGDSLVIFPQASVLGVEVAFKPGVAHIARRFGLPVLPVVISGTHRVWEYPFTETVRYGQGVAMTVLPPIEPMDASIEGIRQVERQMKSLALDDTRSPVRRFIPERDGWWDDYAFDIDDDFSHLESLVAHHRRMR